MASDRGLVDDIVRRADLALSTEWKEPCNETERKLAAIWRECSASMQSVPGRFLWARRRFIYRTTLAAEIEATFDMRFTPADIITLSTVAQQAEKLPKEQVVASKLPACLILGRAGGPKPPLFIVHGGRGSPSSTPVFLDIVAEERSIYLFQAPGLDARMTPLEEIDENTTVEEIAKSTSKPCAPFSQSGPYHFAAMCAGSFIALEMCHQLEMAGETIGRLILLDPTPAPPLIKPQVRLVREKKHAKGIKFGVARLLGLSPREEARRECPEKAAPGKMTERSAELQRKKLKTRVEQMGIYARTSAPTLRSACSRSLNNSGRRSTGMCPAPTLVKRPSSCAPQGKHVSAEEAFWPNHLGSMQHKVLGQDTSDVLRRKSR